MFDSVYQNCMLICIRFLLFGICVLVDWNITFLDVKLNKYFTDCNMYLISHEADKVDDNKQHNKVWKREKNQCASIT